MGIDSQLNKGILEGCVLKLLENEYLYSGEIVARMRACGFVFSEGTLYPMLLRLEKEGCFIIRRETSENSPPRKFYKLSEGGQQKLRQFTENWLETTACVGNVFKETKPSNRK